MTYIQRAARRLATVGASDGAAGVRPAIPSRSPLAVADQRLNVDSFSERFHAPIVPERTAPLIDEAEAAATPPSAPQPEERHEAARPPATNARPAPRAPRPGDHSQPATTETAGSRRRAIPPHIPTPPDTPAAPPAQRSAHGDRETPAAPLKAPDRAARRAVALPSPSPLAPIEAARSETGATLADDSRTPAPERARAASADATEGAGPPAHEAAAQPIIHALSRAMSWVERQPERERVEERGTPAAVARSPFGEISPMRPARAAARERAPVTHLEIGRIEVEIVPPPRPAPQAAQHRPAPKTNGPGSALRQPFGWRQR